MIANYHTHTTRCNHATGTDEEYVLQALAAGIQILGFSDHTPHWAPCCHNYVRMTVEEFPGYMQSLQALKEAYRGRIQLHIGLEAEYYPKYFPETHMHLKEAGVEYLLLGQHWVGDDPVCGCSSFAATQDESILEKYCDQCIAALRTGVFTYIAHPDLLNFVGEEAVYIRQYRRLCKEARELGIPLEINFVGLRTGRYYPRPLFWQIAAEEGCSAVLGCDAHAPEHLTEATCEPHARVMAKQLGLQVLPTVPLRPL